MNKVPLFVYIANLIAIIVPFIGLIIACFVFWDNGFDWPLLCLFLGGYFLTGIGITIGYHRLFTHRSFETVRPIKFILAVLGSMAIEGSVIKWVSNHRKHHQHSDQVEDPHSPHTHGSGIIGILKGLFHSHVGWIFNEDSKLLSGYVKDLQKDKMIVFVSRMFPVWVVLSLVIPALLGYIIYGTLLGMFLGFLWGGLVRIFIVHHITWSINSMCHLWGSQPFDCHDHSRNNVIAGVLAWGEGWHNNHHAFPNSARHGLKWWQIDVSYYIVKLLCMCRLAWNVKVPKTV